MKPTTPSKILWLKNKDDGYLFLDYNAKIIYLYNTTLFSQSVYLDLNIYQLEYNIQDFVTNNDGSLFSFSSNIVKNFRHSSFVTYNIYDYKNKKTIISIKDAQYFQFGNKNNSDLIFYIKDNNIFYQKINNDNSAAIQITNDGSLDQFYNGISDWVYEEEVLSESKAVWISPNDKYIAYLSFDDYRLDNYKNEIYFNSSSDTFAQYPLEQNTKYPKVNKMLPKVILNVHNVETNKKIYSKKYEKDTIISDIVWSKDSKFLIIRKLNRQQNLRNTSVLNVETQELKSTRSERAGYDPIQNKSDNGWFQSYNHDLITYISTLR